MGKKKIRTCSDSLGSFVYDNGHEEDQDTVESETSMSVFLFEADF